MNTTATFFNFFSSKQKLNTTISMQDTYIRKLEKQVERVNTLNKSFKSLENSYKNIHVMLSNLNFKRITELGEKLESVDLDNIQETEGRLNDINDLKERAEEIINSFEGIDADVMEDMQREFEENSNSFKSEESTDYTDDIDEINTKLSLLKIGGILGNRTHKNKTLTTLENYASSALEFLINTIDIITVENLKHSPDYDLEIDLIQNNIISISFLDRLSNSYLGLEFSINIEKETYKPFVDTENIFIQEDLVGLELNKVFEFYLENKSIFK